MEQRVFNFGVSRVVIGSAIIENAPCIVMVEGMSEDSQGEPTQEEMDAISTSGVILRLVNLDGALSLINAVEAAVTELQNRMIAAEASEASPDHGDGVDHDAPEAEQIQRPEVYGK